MLEKLFIKKCFRWEKTYRSNEEAQSDLVLHLENNKDISIQEEFNLGSSNFKLKLRLTYIDFFINPAERYIEVDGEIEDGEVALHVAPSGVLGALHLLFSTVAGIFGLVLLTKNVALGAAILLVMLPIGIVFTRFLIRSAVRNVELVLRRYFELEEVLN